VLLPNTHDGGLTIIGPRCAVKHADRAARGRDRPHEPFDRFVAGAVPVLLDQVLPDPLQAQTGVEFSVMAVR
jgi:hypothetical protein